MHFHLVQQVVAPLLHGRKLALLDELPHPDGSNLKNFRRSICRNEFHQAHADGEERPSIGQSWLNSPGESERATRQITAAEKMPRAAQVVQ